MKIFNAKEWEKQGKTLNEMFAEVALEKDPVEVDLRGTWEVDETVEVVTPPNSVIRAGIFKATGPMECVLRLTLGSATQVTGMLDVTGYKESSWVKNRLVPDGVHLHLANGCFFDGFRLKFFKRWGIVNATERGSNIIGCDLGKIKASFCGSPGHFGVAEHTVISGIVHQIDREGGQSIVQRAYLHWHEGLNTITPGDYVSFDNGDIAYVTGVEDGLIEVWPWPTFSGTGTWEVRGIVGGAAFIKGGNTTQVMIRGLVAQYCGHALRVEALYGCHCDALIGEVVGSALTLGNIKATTWGVTVRGFHPEITVTSVLVAGTNVQRCTIISPVVDIIEGQRGMYLRPRYHDGSLFPWEWKLVQIPAIP